MRIAHKEIGETPLMCMRRLFDTERNTCTYAGRLDPIADGLLLVLENEECKDAKKYHGLDKTYQYTCVVGVATDSYDCLGRVTETQPVSADIAERITEAVRVLTGSVTLPYPPYSSKTVDGAALFVHARRGTLGDVTIPSVTTHIYAHTVGIIEPTDSETVRLQVVPRIQAVRGDFRQEAILSDWSALPAMPLCSFSGILRVSAGTYVRAVVRRIGEIIGYPTVVISLTRTGIGPWTERDVHGQQFSASG